MSEPVVRHGDGIDIEKPACPFCGQALDSAGICVDRCQLKKADEDDTKPGVVRQG